MEKIKRLNFNYELELYEIPHNSVKMNARLDHFIPWYAKSDESFVHYTNLTPAFLSYVERKTKKKLGTFLKENEAKEVVNIWGNLSPFAKMINSRFHSLKMAKDLQLFSPSEIVNNELELTTYIKSHPSDNYVIKDECSVSGRGTRVLKLLSGEGLTFPIRIEPFYHRVHDLGVSAYFSKGTYEIRGCFHNRIIESFAVQGGVFYKEIKSFFLANGLGEDLYERFCEQVEKILVHYGSLDVEGDFQFDNFLYKDSNEEIQIYPLVEVNYRKTLANLLMGFENSSHVEWVKVHLKSSLSYKKINELDHDKIFIMGPEGQTNIDIVICCDDKSEADTLKKYLLTKSLVDFIY